MQIKGGVTLTNECSFGKRHVVLTHVNEKGGGRPYEATRNPTANLSLELAETVIFDADE